MNCASCGASISPEETKCPSCGRLLPDTEAPGTDAAAEQPVPSESLQELLQRKPSALGAGVRLLLMLIFGLVFAGLAVFFFIVSGKRGDAPLLFQGFAVIFGLGGLALAVGGAVGLMRLTRSPLERVPAVVLGKRDKPAPRSSGETTIYFLQIRTDDGRSKEHTVNQGTYESVHEGDTGIAYLKGGYLLDFKSVRLPET